jgi:acetyl esterase/lipase
MDFSHFGHPTEEWLQFVRNNPAAGHDGFDNNSLASAAQLRLASNQARKAAGARLLAESELSEQVGVSTVQVPSSSSHSIPLKIYKPKNIVNGGCKGAILYFHGGGFLFGDEETDDFLCYSIAVQTESVVLSCIYRHTDEHRHPAQVVDAWDTFQYICKHASSLDPSIQQNLVVMGISAGCTLAAGVILCELEHSREHGAYTPLIKGALFGIPWLIHVDNYPLHLFKSPEVSAKIQNADSPVIPSERLKLFSTLLGAKDPKDRLLNFPMIPDDGLSGWPKTAFLVAGADPLRDDGLLFAKKLESIRYVIYRFSSCYTRRSELILATAYLQGLTFILVSHTDSADGQSFQLLKPLIKQSSTISSGYSERKSEEQLQIILVGLFIKTQARKIHWNFFQQACSIKKRPRSSIKCFNETFLMTRLCLYDFKCSYILICVAGFVPSHTDYTFPLPYIYGIVKLANL